MRAILVAGYVMIVSTIALVARWLIDEGEAE